MSNEQENPNLLLLIWKFIKAKTFIIIGSLLLPIYIGVIIYDFQRSDEINKNKITYFDKIIKNLETTEKSLSNITNLLQNEKINKNRILIEFDKIATAEKEFKTNYNFFRIYTNKNYPEIDHTYKNIDKLRKENKEIGQINEFLKAIQTVNYEFNFNNNLFEEQVRDKNKCYPDGNTHINSNMCIEDESLKKKIEEELDFSKDKIQNTKETLEKISENNNELKQLFFNQIHIDINENPIFKILKRIISHPTEIFK